MSDSDIEEIIRNQIHLLHDYNELKDIGQMLLGKYAEIQGTTTAEMYNEFGLNLMD